MDDAATPNLIRDLVLRLLSYNGRPSPDPVTASDALRYAHRLLSSRMSPSITPDESAMAESIKRTLALNGRHSDALSFADLYSKLTHRSSIKNRWALLYLLKSIADDRKKTLSSSIPKVAAGLPSLPLPTPKKTLPSSVAGVGGGVLLLSKDSDNIQEIALREFADLVAEETEVSEFALVRDILYVSQGIDGRYVKFVEKSDSYELLESLKVPRCHVPT